MNKLLNYVFPWVCSLCDKGTPLDERYICRDCLSQLTYTGEDNCPLCGTDFDTLLDICPQCVKQSRPWTRGGAPLKFEGNSREIVHHFKYNSKLVLSRFLVPEMVFYLRRKLTENFSAVTMVPLHWSRQWKRGYNQAEVLAAGIAEEMSIPCLSLLKRSSSRSAQALKNKAQRQKNISGIFHVPKKKYIPKGTILLIDDVMTTGTTLAACTGALLEAGADEVCVLTAARG